MNANVKAAVAAMEQKLGVGTKPSLTAPVRQVRQLRRDAKLNRRFDSRGEPC
jgi:hypothetical protein